MISCHLTVFFIFFFFLSLTSPAQKIPETDPVLYNGKIYTYHLSPGTRGDQYLISKDFRNGWLKIKGSIYEGQFINYDVLHQQVIMKYLTSGGAPGMMIISDAWLEAFGYDNMEFEAIADEIYQVIGKEPVRVLFHWAKTLRLSNEYGAKNYVFSRPQRKMFLELNDTIIQFSGNKTFIEQIGSAMDDSLVDRVKEYMKRNRIILRKADESLIKELLTYCNSFFFTGNKSGDNDTLKLNPKQETTSAGIRIFYKQDFHGISDTADYPDNVPLIERLKQSLEGTGFTAKWWNDDIIIIPDTILITTLPGYRGTVNDSASLNGSKTKMTQTEAKYLTSRSQGITRVITAGKQGGYLAGPKARITGRILDEETGEPLMSVPVYISETKSGALTDVNGFVTLALLPGNYNLEVAYLGYAAIKVILRVLSDGSFTLNLQKAAIRLQDVVVSATSESNIRMRKAGLDQVSVRNLKSLPVMMGEQDVLKVSVTLPGIVSVGEGSAGLNVRGGGYDQNSFYINRIPVYNTSHLFGFFSAFNSDIVRDISIYKGYIPVKYGGRLASVFDITARQGNRKHFTAHGGISPITGNITVEGPLIKDNSSFIISARSSYSDWILSRLRDTTIRSSSANFHDVSGGLSMDTEKSRLSLFFYNSNDRFSLAKITDYDYSNNGLSAVFSHTYSNALRSEISLSGSVYDFTTSDRLEPSSAYTYSYRLGHYGANLVFNHILNDIITFDYGIDFSLYDLDRGTVRPYDEKSLRTSLAMGNERGMEGSLFTSGFFRFSPSISLDLGLRYGVFIPAGPASVYIYRYGVPVDPRYIIDTLFFGRNEILKKYHQPDIRASVNIRTDDNGSVKAAFNQMHQNIFMLNSGITPAPNTQWKLADYHLKPSRSNLLSLGLYRTFPFEALEASAEIYYKTAENYPEFREGADFLKNPFVESLVLQGRQKAYGFELYVKRSDRKLEGWISYAYSRSVIRVNGQNSWDRINSGRPYPSNYDIPHSVNAVLSYHFTRRLILSSVFTYQTGKPVTYPESVYYVDRSQYLDYSGRNAYRIPDYMRIDLSLTIEGNLKAGKPVHSSYIFNLYNATGRLNPHSVYFKSENGRIRSYMYSVVGIPIFTATWQFKLGNYASD